MNKTQLSSERNFQVLPLVISSYITCAPEKEMEHFNLKHAYM